jgi:hypothetical protein
MRHRPTIICIGLFIVAVVVSGVISFKGPEMPLIGWGTTLAQQNAPVAPPPPSPVPPNASHITATVLNASIWPPGSLRGTRPPVLPDQSLHSVRVEIHTAEPEQAELASYAQPGSVLEAFSAEALTSASVGKRISATMTLTGDTRGVRWWISAVHLLP